jgi:hypothetical protein
MADWFSCLADTKSRVSCFTADLDLEDANMAESDLREVHHQTPVFVDRRPSQQIHSSLDQKPSITADQLGVHH